LHFWAVLPDAGIYKSTRFWSIVLPIETRPSGAFRGPPEVSHTHEITSHGGPSTRRAAAWRSLGAPYVVFSYVCGTSPCTQKAPEGPI
jgi:hypothetical protein